MIHTITFNPAIDKFYKIPDFKIGSLNHCHEIHQCAGGKGINVSRILFKHGIENKLHYFSDTFFQAKILAEFNTNDCFPFYIKNNVRENIKIIDLENNSHTEINQISINVDENEIASFINELQQGIFDNDFVVLSGSFPSTFNEKHFNNLMKFFSAKNIRLYLDIQGNWLKESLNYQPYLIKPNKQELKESFDINLDDILSLENFLIKCKQQHIRYAIITNGADGIFTLNDNEIIQIKMNVAQVRNTVGAGDSLLAGLIYAESIGLTNIEALKYAVAIASEYVSTDILHRIICPDKII